MLGRKSGARRAVNCWLMAPSIEKISAVTVRVRNMKASVQFYRDVLGMELLYAGQALGAADLPPQQDYLHRTQFS